VFNSSQGMFWTRAERRGKPQTVDREQGSPVADIVHAGRQTVCLFRIECAGALIRTVPLDGASGQLRAGDPESFCKHRPDCRSGVLADGRWLALRGCGIRQLDVYVRAFPDKGTRWLISNGRRDDAVWSRNGRDLFIERRQPDHGATYTVRGDTFVVDRPRAWSDKRLANTGLTRNFDSLQDGKRFVC